MGALNGGDDVEDRRRQFARLRKFASEPHQFGFARQLAVEEQVGGLLEGGVLGQVMKSSSRDSGARRLCRR